MRYLVHVFILPHDDLRDPQGMAVEAAMRRLGLSVSEGRVGKIVRFSLEAPDEASARAQIEDVSRRLLTNPVIERFWYEMEERE
ncbi:MAG: phosphoribosylformylglycinamidine synthase subunit PurS [candidate division WOR-3 bacterium]